MKLNSTEYLKDPLEDYIAQNFTNVFLHRSNERLGLIRARMAGAKFATGEVSYPLYFTGRFFYLCVF